MVKESGMELNKLFSLKPIVNVQKNVSWKFEENFTKDKGLHM